MIPLLCAALIDRLAAVQGYRAITGVDPPFIGMCWWVNGLLLPELTVVR